MYGASSLLDKAVSVGLVQPRSLARLARSVRRRAAELPSWDLVWADELVRAGCLTRYQAHGLLLATEAAHFAVEAGTGTTAFPLEIGPYVVLDRVGHSDVGTMYCCRPRDGVELHAVRLLENECAKTAATLSDLTAVAEKWASLHDDRVVCWQPVETTGRVAIASRWVHAHSLADHVRGRRRLSVAATADLARQLIAALARAEAQGLVHGDLRPSNIKTDGRGRVLLLECGLRTAINGAGLTIERALPPERYDYAAPELARGHAPDAASDLYALGCVLYHVVTGRPPFFGGSAPAKCTAHQTGRLPDPASLGIALPPDLRAILNATIQPDRGLRVGSYNELLSLLPPARAASPRRLRAELAQRPLTRITLGTLDRAAAPHRGRRLLFAAVAAIGVAVALVSLAIHGSRRLLPLLQLPPAKHSVAAAASALPKTDVAQPLKTGTVTTLWNATEDLRLAYRRAEPHSTITLKSSGPFLMDALEIDKPITLRGDRDVSPLFVGGPGAALRITAAEVRLENLHFLRVNERTPGQTRRDSDSMIDCRAAHLSLTGCSFQDLSGDPAPAAAVRWAVAGDSARKRPATLAAHNVLSRHVGGGFRVTVTAGARLVLNNCAHFGPGPLLVSSTSAGDPHDSLDVTLARVTVYGAAALDHSFPHTLDGATALAVIAERSVFVPRDREQPVLVVRYAAHPGTLLPKVAWSGSGTVCPADATLLEVWRGPETPPWRAHGIAAWHAFWGPRQTGVVGVRSDFAASSGPENLPVASRLQPPTDDSAAGADPRQLRYPTDVVLQQLPLLLERLANP